MAIGNKQIGWSNESNLLWQIGKLIERLTSVTSASGSTPSLPYKLISEASTNETVVKDSSGTINSIIAVSLSETVTYLKLYNQSTLPTVGTDIPVMTIPIPTNTAGAGFVIPLSNGLQFSEGISFAITSGVADSDTGAIAADVVVINFTYK
jgi:hypothetical protein